MNNWNKQFSEIFFFNFRIGRNVARSLWDYYKILGVIPLEAENVAASHGVDKNGACVRSFNLLRSYFQRSLCVLNIILFDKEELN